MEHVKHVGTFKLLEKIGDGGFSTVYKCRGQKGKLYALKVGHDDVRGEFDEHDGDVSSMAHMEEWLAYQTLQYGQDVANQRGIPRVYETGASVKGNACRQLPSGLAELGNGEMRPYLVMQLLGRSLNGVIVKESWNRDRFFECALSMVDSLEYVHSKGYIHRDVKVQIRVWGWHQECAQPSNFCFDVSKGPKLFLLDLGFACAAPTKTDQSKVEFVGTPDYSSSPALRGHRQSYRDDMESLAYTLLEMWLKELPWFLTNSESIKDNGWTRQNLAKLASKRSQIWKELIKVPLRHGSLLQYPLG